MSEGFIITIRGTQPRDQRDSLPRSRKSSRRTNIEYSQLTFELMQPGISKLANPILLYDWGSRDFIARLQARPTPSAEPEAELWIGDHPRAPSRLDAADGESLPAQLARDPEALLGRRSVARFGSRLPFLMKVLAAASPLSIQVHPNAKQARRGFEEEERRGLALDARERIYFDPRHKIELMIALEPFSALCGFRPSEQVDGLVHQLGSSVIDRLCAELDRGDPDFAARLYFSTFALSSSERDRLSEDLLAFARRDREDLAEAFWVLRLARLHPGDPGALAPLLLNLLVLAPGDGLVVAPGTIHSYLEGSGIEVMSSSDNVVRGGLTTKYIDEAEFRRLAVCEPFEPLITRPVVESPGIVRYPVPAEEFLVRVLSPADGSGALDRPPANSARIMLCVEGSSTLRAVSSAGGTDSLELAAGEAAWIPAAVGKHTVSAVGRSATLYEVSVA